MAPNGVGTRPQLLLASASPRRRELLWAAGIAAGAVAADVDETRHDGESARAMVARLAETKATAVYRMQGAGSSPRCGAASRDANGPDLASASDADDDAGSGPSRDKRRSDAEPGRSRDGDRVVCIGADTVVTVDESDAVDGELFGKPETEAEARTMLSRLSGRAHKVLTGVAVVTADRAVAAVDETTVWFRTLDAAEIDCYVASGEPMGKAGAYAIQGRGSLFVDRIDGSFQGVVGLPMRLLDQLCGDVGWPLTTWAAAGR